MRNEIYTVASLEHDLEWIKKNLELNNQKPEDVEVTIKQGWHEYPIYGFSLGWGKTVKCQIEYFESDEIKVVAPDSRPEGGGEFWYSRGCGTGCDGFPDCSGFVVSKKAGERISRMVKYILEDDEPSSYLDYREYEPTHIQYKFSGTEFDVEKLSKESKENNGVITEEMLRNCMVGLHKKEFLKRLEEIGLSDFENYEKGDVDWVDNDDINYILGSCIDENNVPYSSAINDPYVMKFLAWSIANFNEDIAIELINEFKNDGKEILRDSNQA